MKWILAFFTLSGINIVFWSLVGLIRYISEKVSIIGFKERQERNLKNNSNNLLVASYRINVHEVAAVVPAHNEELSITATLQSLKKILPKENIYVGSDASTDRTIEIVHSQGCNVTEIWPNRGKAGVLIYLLEHFQLLEQYKAILFVDADTEIDENYFKRALPLFDDYQVMAVAGHVVSKWQNHRFPQWSMFFIAYRTRIYRILQALLRYGQTWKLTNVTSIIPGFASIYRTSALSDITIDAPGLIIEDYNMTFELHHKKLGEIAYSPGVIGVTQDPKNFKDYAKQIKRWNLGFWQTVRRHGIWPSFFWLALGLFIAEMILFGLFLLFIPFLFEWFYLTSFSSFLLLLPTGFSNSIQIGFLDVIFGVFVVDYFITAIVALIEKKPILLLYGIGFIILRLMDAYMFIVTLPMAFFVKSEGKWVSPKR